MTSPSTTPYGLRRQPGASLQHQVFVLLKDAIRSGRLRPGDPLPSEDRLAQDFGVSRVTLRHAMARLQADGLVARRQGIGTFVAAPAHDAAIHAPHADLLAHIRQVGENTRVRLLALDVVPSVAVPTDARDFFASSDEASFHRAIRLRSTDEGPVFHVTTLLPDALARRITRDDWNTRSLYALLSGRRVRLSSGEQAIGAVLAEPEEARLLEVPVGAPLLRARRFHRDQHGHPVAYVEMLASPDRFEIRLTLDPPIAGRRRR